MLDSLIKKSMWFSISLALVLLGAGCINTTAQQPSPESIVQPAVSDKPYYPENQVAAANGEIFIEREHFSGMQHCADVIHVFRGKNELFEANLADCLPKKDVTDVSGQNFIYRYQFSIKQENPTMFTFISKNDPVFSLLDEQNKQHPTQIWLQVNEKMIMFDEEKKIFTEATVSILPNIFTSQVAAGETYGSLKVSNVISKDLDAQPLYQGINVEFVGNATLVGTLRIEQGMGPEYTIIDLTTDSLKQLPHFKDDTRSTWFGVSNDEIIKKLNLQNNDRVELVISKYRYRFAPAEVWNDAEVVSIKRVLVN